MVDANEPISFSTKPPSKENEKFSITGSIVYQLEMRAAMDHLTSLTQEIQKQAKENAEESGQQAPSTPTL